MCHESPTFHCAVFGLGKVGQGKFEGVMNCLGLHVCCENPTLLFICLLSLRFHIFSLENTGEPDEISVGEHRRA